MKHVLLSILFAVAGFAAQAQAPAYAAAQPKAEVTRTSVTNNTTPTKNVVYITAANQWAIVDMKVSGEVAYFSNIDGMGSLRVIVTNSDGVEQINTKINADANGINFKRLKKGLYFLTLVNEATEDKKAFMLNRE